MLSKSLEDILLGLSCLEIRKQYNQDPLLVEPDEPDNYDDYDDLDLQDD